MQRYDWVFATGLQMSFAPFLMHLPAGWYAISSLLRRYIFVTSSLFLRYIIEEVTLNER